MVDPSSWSLRICLTGEQVTDVLPRIIFINYVWGTVEQTFIFSIVHWKLLM